MALRRESLPQTWNLVFAKAASERTYNRAIVEAVLRNTGPVTGKRILEVGLGEGPDAIELAHQGARVHILDFASNPLRSSLSGAEQRKVTVHPTQADGRVMPFPTDSFDVVFSQGLLEHYEPADSLLAEQVRITKPGGLVIVDVPQLFSPQAVTKAFLMRSGKWPYGWERNYTEEQLTTLMKRHGLNIVDHYAWGFLPPLNLGIRTRIREALRTKKSNPNDSSSPSFLTEIRRLSTQGHHSWLARHSLNCIGVIGQKE